MTTAGWIFMIIAWSAVTLGLAFCFYLILKEPKNIDAGPPSGRM